MAFAFTVFKKLSIPENHLSEQKNTQTPQQIPQASGLTNAQYYQLNKLAALSFWYVQLEEALGRTPTLQDFGSSKFGQVSEILDGDINEAWKIFLSAINAAKQVLPTSEITYDPPKTMFSSVKPETTREPAKTRPASVKSSSSSTSRPTVQLNREAISKLQKELSNCTIAC